MFLEWEVLYYMRSRVARAARESYEIWTEKTSYPCIYDLSITQVHSFKPANTITGFVAGDNKVKKLSASRSLQCYM